MKFKSLRAENFMRLGSIELPLDEQGLVLILGENRDAPNASSNGAGKSSLLDALCWCLWDKTIRKLSADDVVHEDVGRDCSVSVSWEDDGHEYKVTRYRRMTGRKKPNDVELEIDGELQDGAGMASTDRRIVDLLGLTFETFQAMMPGAGLKAAELTDAKIKALLEELLQMNVISKAQSLAKADLKNTQQELKLVQHTILGLEQGIQDQESLLEKYKEGLSSFEETKQQDLLAIDLELANIQEEIDNYSGIIASETKQTALVDKVQKQYKQKTQLYKKLTNEKAAWEAEQQQLRDNLKRLVTKANVELLQLEDLKKSTQQLTDSCGTCGQSISEEYHASLIQSLEENIESKRTEVAIQEAALSGWQNSYDLRLVEYQTELSNLNKAIDLLKTQMTSVETQLSAILHAKADCAKLESRSTALNQRRTAVAGRQSPFEGLIAAAVEKGSELASSWAAAKQQEQELQERETMLTFWVTGFSAKGLRSLMLKHVTPILNARAKYYSDLLTDGEMEIEFSTSRQLSSGKSKEEFTIHVKQQHGSSSYKGASSGERGRADLAIAFALGDLAHLRARKRIPFRFLDEPFEHIDEAGHEWVMALLAEQRETYSTVYCITHNQSFQQLFSRTVTVVKENGSSRLETK